MDAAFKQLTSTTPRMNWQLDQCYKEGCRFERELASVTEQCDRLAEALSGLINYTNTLELHLSTPFHAFKDNEHPNMQSAKNELAAVKGVSDDR